MRMGGRQQLPRDERPKTRLLCERDRQFESRPLQRGVRCELDPTASAWDLEGVAQARWDFMAPLPCVPARVKQEGLPLPAAIAPGTPWSDLTETGDTYKTNEWLDNILVSYNGYISHAATLYANGHDLKDPQLSPIYGDFHGFPPAILTSGTRDLFLSLTVLTHRKLRQAGVEATLQVFEGMSHAQYLFDPYAPETKEVFTEIAQFFDRHLGK